MSDKSRLYYSAKVKLSESAEQDEGDKPKNLFIEGLAIESGTSRNNVHYSDDELQAAAETLVGVPLLINHGQEDVKNIVGKVTEASFANGKIPFKAIVDKNETWLVNKLKNGFCKKLIPL